MQPACGLHSSAYLILYSIGCESPTPIFPTSYLLPCTFLPWYRTSLYSPDDIMIINNDMNKIPYIPPQAECIFGLPQCHLLRQLSVPGSIDADFGDLAEQDEWGL